MQSYCNVQQDLKDLMMDVVYGNKCEVDAPTGIRLLGYMINVATFIALVVKCVFCMEFELYYIYICCIIINLDYLRENYFRTN